MVDVVASSWQLCADPSCGTASRARQRTRRHACTKRQHVQSVACILSWASASTQMAPLCMTWWVQHACLVDWLAAPLASGWLALSHTGVHTPSMQCDSCADRHAVKTKDYTICYNDATDVIVGASLPSAKRELHGGGAGCSVHHVQPNACCCGGGKQLAPGTSSTVAWMAGGRWGSFSQAGTR